MKLLEVDTVQEVKQKMEKYYGDIVAGYEEVEIIKALSRTAFEDVFSQVNIPDFNRSTVDGYAVVTKDTYGAGESMPAFLNITGKVEMGKATALKVSSGSCVYVPTGGMIPEGADGMLMIEYVEPVDEGMLAAHSPVAPGENIIFTGDDVKLGEKVISRGRVIRSRDIGVLCAAGISHVKVSKKPRVAVVSTGDEIVDPFGQISPGQVRDINTYTLSAMVQELGGEVTGSIVVRDDYELIRSTVDELSKSNDIVVISGGSSVGAKDNTEKVIDSFGEPGVFVHGVAVKPGKPTILGRVGNAAVFGLPGHPVSAVVIFKLFVEELIGRLLGKNDERLFINALCSSNLHSSPGKETYQMVELEEGENSITAKPIHAKSAAISQLSKAHGVIRIPVNKEGIKKGEAVKVELFR
ncbi:MAG TPA: gephyrin-like molybdotransferase Glp [Clostridia bacterium]|nr:gephyrin-like molybdotransferase Glp [Clostridia bacterium]